jgi:hypothetical protein
MNDAMLDKNLFCSHLINANPKTKEQNEQSLSLLLLNAEFPSSSSHERDTPSLAHSQATSSTQLT